MIGTIHLHVNSMSVEARIFASMIKWIFTTSTLFKVQKNKFYETTKPSKGGQNSEPGKAGRTEVKSNINDMI